MNLFPFLKLLFLILFFLTCSNSRQLPPKAQKGVLDLRNWNLAEHGILKLDGEWEFYPMELPDEKGELSEERMQYIKVPKSWNGFVYKDKKGETKEMAGVGYGTYHLKILTSIPMLSFKSPTQASNFFFFCEKEKKLQSGTVGTTQTRSFPNWKVHDLISCETHLGELNLTLTISNFHHRSGGFWNSILVGIDQDILKEREHRLSLDLFLAGILFIMGSYHVSLFYLRREDKSAIYFGSFCLLITIRTLLIGEGYIYNFYPALSYEIGSKIEYLTLYLGIPIFNEYFTTLYPDDINNNIRKFILWICLPLSLIVVFFSTLYFSQTLPIIQILVLISIIYSLWVLTKAIRNGRLGANTFLLGFTFYSILIVNDILHLNQLINTGNYGSLGLVVFIFSQSFLLSSRFANAFHQVKDLTFNLEKKVEERTKTLEETTQSLVRVNKEIAHSRKEAEDALQKAKTLNEMVEVIIQSKSTDEIFERIFELFSEKYGLTSYLVYIVDKSDGFIRLYKLYGDANLSEEYYKILYKNYFSIQDKTSLQGICISQISNQKSRERHFRIESRPLRGAFCRAKSLTVGYLSKCI